MSWGLGTAGRIFLSRCMRSRASSHRTRWRGASRARDAARRWSMRWSERWRILRPLGPHGSLKCHRFANDERLQRRSPALRYYFRVNRTIIIAVFVFLFVVSGIGLYVISGPKPATTRTPAATAPAPVVVPPPTPTAPPTIETPRPARRAAASASTVAPPPGEAPAPPPDLVTLHVDSDVAGAQVFIDRQFVGAAPVTTTEVKPGTHQINVSATGTSSTRNRSISRPARGM